MTSRIETKEPAATAGAATNCAYRCHFTREQHETDARVRHPFMDAALTPTAEQQERADAGAEVTRLRGAIVTALEQHAHGKPFEARVTLFLALTSSTLEKP